MMTDIATDIEAIISRYAPYYSCREDNSRHFVETIEVRSH